MKIRIPLKPLVPRSLASHLTLKAQYHRRHLGFALVYPREMHLIKIPTFLKPVSMPLNLFAYMNKIGLSIPPILLIHFLRKNTYDVAQNLCHLTNGQ